MVNVNRLNAGNAKGKFIVKNTAQGGKAVRVFNNKIENGQERNLLNIPAISEAIIKNSLLKGELYQKLRNGDIVIVDSDIDLLQYNEEHKTFLESKGVPRGLEANLPENISVFTADGTWTKPANVNTVWILIVTAGGGGGNGFSGAEATGRGGGGGGASGGSLIYLNPAKLLPDTLNITIGLGAGPTPVGGTAGQGGNTILAGPDGTVWYQGPGGRSSAPAVATGLVNGGGGSPPFPVKGTMPMRLLLRGGESVFANESGGATGGAGGRGLVGAGSPPTELNDLITAGAGGSGIRSTDVTGFAGASVGPATTFAAASNITIAGGIAEGGHGQNGTTAFDLTTLSNLAQLPTWWARGGAGGGSSNTGAGGNGGNGAPGCGGGGGGAGTTGGLGGRGGNGFVIICSW